MKNTIVALVVAFVSLVSGCADSRVICNKEVRTYGIFNEDKKVANVHYETSIGNVVWSVILIETVVVPVWLVGFSLYQPVSSTTQCK